MSNIPPTNSHQPLPLNIPSRIDTNVSESAGEVPNAEDVEHFRRSVDLWGQDVDRGLRELRSAVSTAGLAQWFGDYPGVSEISNGSGSSFTLTLDTSWFTMPAGGSLIYLQFAMAGADVGGKYVRIEWSVGGGTPLGIGWTWTFPAYADPNGYNDEQTVTLPLPNPTVMPGLVWEADVEFFDAATGTPSVTTFDFIGIFAVVAPQPISISPPQPPP